MLALRPRTGHRHLMAVDLSPLWQGQEMPLLAFLNPFHLLHAPMA